MKEIIEKINLAQNSSNIDELDKLSTSNNYKIRRAVARNENTSQKTLKKLQTDPILNVAFMANVNAINKVVFNDSPSLQNPCVICEKDESTFHIVCKSCINDVYLNSANLYYS